MPLATDTRKLSHVITTHDKLKLTARQFKVLETLQLIGPSTNEEIREHLGWQINWVTGRTFELRQFGVVVDAGRRKCKITGNICHVWKTK